MVGVFTCQLCSSVEEFVDQFFIHCLSAYISWNFFSKSIRIIWVRLIMVGNLNSSTFRKEERLYEKCNFIFYFSGEVQEYLKKNTLHWRWLRDEGHAFGILGPFFILFLIQKEWLGSWTRCLYKINVEEGWWNN